LQASFFLPHAVFIIPAHTGGIRREGIEPSPGIPPPRPVTVQSTNHFPLSTFLSNLDKPPRLPYLYGMQTVTLDIYDESKTAPLLGLLRDLRYVEVRGPVPSPPDDVYAGIPSAMDDDLLQSQLDLLEKAEW
jgi:hypothetical protein